MGRAIIVSGGADGRYTITTDFGSTTRAAVLAGLQTNLDRLQIQLGQAIAAKNESDAKAEERRTQLASLANSHASSVSSGGGATSGDNAIATALEQVRTDWVLSSMLAGDARRKVDAIRLDIAYIQQQLARWNSLQTSETRQAWCVDYTTNAAAGASVATLDINGEGALTVIAPGCRAPATSDGQLRARQVQSPAQLFVNLAWLPAWQKWKPMYRWGTITALDKDANTASVSLAAATSSAQDLGINQSSSLANVPVTYMTCNASIFEVGDRVVVQFDGQSWGSPRVVGFLDNPRPCNWTCVYLQFATYHFESMLPAQMNAIATGVLEVDVRIDRGPWQVMAERFPSWTGPNLRSFEVYGDLHTPNTTNPGNELVAWIYVHNTTPGAPAGLGPNLWVGFRADYLVSFVSRQVAEFRIRIAGNAVFNVAIADTGIGHEPWDNTGQVKAPGGIDLKTLSTPSYPVTPLDYTLVTESGE